MTSVFLVVKVIVSEVSALLLLDVHSLVWAAHAHQLKPLQLFHFCFFKFPAYVCIGFIKKKILIYSISLKHQALFPNRYSVINLLSCAVRTCLHMHNKSESIPFFLSSFSLCSAALVQKRLWLCFTHHLVCGGVVGNLVPWLQGSHSGSRKWPRWEKSHECKHTSTEIYVLFNWFPPLTSAYLAASNADRASMLYPHPVSDGQFYSPPESVAGDGLIIFAIHLLCILVSFLISASSHFFTDLFVWRLRRVFGWGGSQVQRCHISGTCISACWLFLI